MFTRLLRVIDYPQVHNAKNKINLSLLAYLYLLEKVIITLRVVLRIPK